MKNYTELNLGYNDAVNYQKRHNKSMFNEIFVKDGNLDKLISPDIYFLIGDKGTGKTAYATYLKNNNYKGVKANVINIAETDYKIFYQLKKEHDLTLTDYTRIWKIIILMYFAKNINKDEIDSFGLQRTKKFKELREVIDNYYSEGFVPETKTVLKYIQDSSSGLSINASGKALALNAKSENSNKIERECQTYQNNLLVLENKFTEALSTVKLNNDLFIFFDNADIAHNNISLNDYLEILKGLAEAICQLNNSLLNNLRDSNGYMKVVLLIRPEIFAQLNIHNQANIITDNAIYLTWQTTYANYRNSKLFELSNRIFKYGNDMKNIEGSETYWDLYFPWHSITSSPSDEGNTPDNSFIELLRNSLCRPRDLITILKIIQTLEKNNFTEDYFTHRSSIESPEFRKELASYYINEAKDWCLYQYNAKQFDTIIYFFDFIKGRVQFTYDEYSSYFDIYAKKAIDLGTEAIFDLLLDKDAFLQLLFDMNFICYVDYDFYNNPYYKFSYKEKSFSNLHPKIKLGVNYKIHPAIARGLNAGRSYK